MEPTKLISSRATLITRLRNNTEFIAIAASELETQISRTEILPFTRDQIEQQRSSSTPMKTGTDNLTLDKDDISGSFHENNHSTQREREQRSYQETT